MSLQAPTGSLLPQQRQPSSCLIPALHFNYPPWLEPWSLANWCEFPFLVAVLLSKCQTTDEDLASNLFNICLQKAHPHQWRCSSLPTRLVLTDVNTHLDPGQMDPWAPWLHDCKEQLSSWSIPQAWRHSFMESKNLENKLEARYQQGL